MRIRRKKRSMEETHCKNCREAQERRMENKYKESQRNSEANK